MRTVPDPQPLDPDRWTSCPACGQPAGAWRTDQLTGVLNRWGWYDRAPAAFLAASTSGAAVTVLYVDVDHLKDINDLAGHRAGDAVIIAVADELKKATDGNGLVSRVGGDEFLVLLPFTDTRRGLATAQRICGGVRRRRAEAHHMDAVTTSIGVATREAGADPPPDLDVLIDEADTALAMAKRHGRDRVCTTQAPKTNHSLLDVRPHG